MAVRGFHAVGVMDIGTAAGVSGAALYRHFETKTAVLVAVFDRAIDGLLLGVELVAPAQGDPDRVLVDLVSAHVDFALRDRMVLAVYSQQIHLLPEADRRRLRRKQRRYVEIWRSVLQAAVPGLADAVALLRVQATFGLLNSVPNISTTVGEDDLRHELGRLALSALNAPNSGV